MFVIFPADELILMTYGAAIPRISPRPTLDCLREPQVPIVIPARSLPPSPSLTSFANLPEPSAASPATTTTAATTSSSSRFFARFRGEQQQQQQTQAQAQIQQPQQNHQEISLNLPQTEDSLDIFASELQQYQALSKEPPAHRLLHTSYERPTLPTIIERASPTPSTTPLTHINAQTATPPLTPTRRTSKSSLKRSTPVQTRRVEQTLGPTSTPPLSLRAPVYNDLNMRSSQQQQQQQQYQRPTLERSSALREPTPLRYNEDPAMAMGGSSANLFPPIQWPTGSIERPSRESSPSLLLEPHETDPTKPRLGPGWGRPMSPMELPPEPSTSQKSPSSKSRILRPKLHIPLGKLGRSTSSEHKESQRLREDLELRVENPIFNTENLRQRNFDAFFDSGEPVYKLQPKTPATAPVDSLTGAPLPPLDNYAGVYDSSPRKNRNVSGGGGLFARSPKEDKLLSSRSKSTEQYDPARDARASSLGPMHGSASVASAGSGGASGTAAGSGSANVPQKDFLGKSSSGQKSRNFFGWRGPRGGFLNPPSSMASYNGVLKDYGHSSLSEAFKTQNNTNFKLIKTVSDFTETLSHLYEEHATALQALVTNFRKKNAELRKERPACHLSIFQAWETFLQEVETDSQASNDVANVLYRQVSRPMLDKSFYRKVQSRKIFTHRESFETIIAKTEEKLSKCRLDYKQSYMSHRQNPTQHSLTEYIDAHNAYVQQLHATNAMLETYHCETVPQLMQELEEIHTDLCSIIGDSIQQGAEVICNKAADQAKRYNSLTVQCTTISPVQDLTNFVRLLPPATAQQQKAPKRPFAPPQPAAGEPDDNGEYNEMAPILRNELVFDRHSSVSLRLALEALKREAMDLEMQIRQLQDSIDVLNRNQVRGIEGQLYNKVNETQEELLMNKFDLRAKQLHLAAIRAQKELFVSKVDPGSPRGERKFSAATAPSMKTKWLKAIKSLKPASGSAAQADRRNGAAGSQPLRPNEDGSHHLQEYTYKKITACDVCSQILRGHTRQGLRCRICKLNAHGDCASGLPRCQPKQKLLRRQKSTSELENRIDMEEENDDQNAEMSGNDQEPAIASAAPMKKFRQKTPFIERIAQLELTDIDQVYRVLKQAGELKNATIAADKSVQNAAAKGGGDGSDIPIVNVPECPERPTAAIRAARGVRPPPVPMPILGVQLQQQELSQQRSGGGLGGGLAGLVGAAAASSSSTSTSAAAAAAAALPVPQQDISSSSDYHLMNLVQMPSVANMTTAAYLSSGIGINYYATSASMMPPQPAPASATQSAIQMQQQQLQQQQQQQQQQQSSSSLMAGTSSSNATTAMAQAICQQLPQQQQQQQYPYMTLQQQQQLLSQQQYHQQQQQILPADSGLRRRLFAGFRPMSGFGRIRSRSSQHRSISLPETPHSPRRQKLNLRMKSLSLDSPESSELHGQMRRRQQPVAGATATGASTSSYYHGGSGGHLEHSTPPSNNSRLHSPSSPSHQGRKLLYASRGMRGGSVDLPDEMEKSQSSASTSPCPSPVRYFQKSHRLLPTNLYVILYNFEARHADELDLKAGYKVTVIDTSDPDWWKGKVLGRIGYFPSKYCVRLNANEKPLQVTHNLQVSDGVRGENMTLLRDQIVIQTGDEVNGMVMVRSADNHQGYCPVKYLQEV